jgi:hypothetical protein
MKVDTQAGSPAPAEQLGQDAIQTIFEACSDLRGGRLQGELKEVAGWPRDPSQTALAAEQESGTGEKTHLVAVVADTRLPGAIEKGGFGHGSVGQFAGILAAPIAEVASSQMNAAYRHFHRYPG